MEGTTIVLKQTTTKRLAAIFEQMNNVQRQYAAKIDDILVTICDENEIDLDKFVPSISEDLTTLTFSVKKQDVSEDEAIEIENEEGIYQLDSSTN